VIFGLDCAIAGAATVLVAATPAAAFLRNDLRSMFLLLLR
jgi:hypothetical protein